MYPWPVAKAKVTADFENGWVFRSYWHDGKSWHEDQLYCPFMHRAPNEKKEVTNVLNRLFADLISSGKCDIRWTP